MAGKVKAVVTPTNGNGKAKPHPKRLTLRDHRCNFCGRLLFHGVVAEGSVVEIRCPRCNRMHTWPEQIAAPEQVIVNAVATIAE